MTAQVAPRRRSNAPAKGIVDALGSILWTPSDYMMRRTETVRVASKDTLSWDIAQQIVLPDVVGEQHDEIEMIVSLGMYSKARLPDLRAFDDTGRELAPLPRDKRATILTSLALEKYVDRLAANADWRNVDIAAFRQELAEGNYDRAESGPFVLIALQFLVRTIVVSSRAVAEEAVDETIRFLAERPDPAHRRLAWDWDLISGLYNLATTTHLLCWLRGRPQSEVVVRHTYTHHFGRHDDERDVVPPPENFITRWLFDHWPWYAETGRKIVDRAVSVMFRALQWCGLASETIALENANVDHCGSYHLLIDEPDGCELSRAYWAGWKPTYPERHAQAPTEVHDSKNPVLSLHSYYARSSDGRAYIEIRPARAGVVRTAAAACALMFAAMFYLSREPAVDAAARNAVALGASVPAYLAGILAGIQSEFGLRVMRGPRLLVLGTALGSAITGFLIAVLASAHAVQHAAQVVTVLAAFSTLVLGYIAWRRSPQGQSSPAQTRADIRKRQRHEREFAAVYLIGAAVLSVAAGIRW